LPARLRLLLPGAGLLAVAAFAVYPLLSPQVSDLRPQPPARAPFTDVTAEAGIAFRHVSGATGKKYLPETMGAGVAVLAYAGEGRPALFFVNGRPWPGDPESPGGRPPPALYRNRGDGTFEDVTAAAGLDVVMYGMGVTVGDYDNDGRPDLLVTAV